jgi:hypothetical protein
MGFTRVRGRSLCTGLRCLRVDEFLAGGTDLERSDRNGEFWGNPKTRTFAEPLIGRAHSLRHLLTKVPKSVGSLVGTIGRSIFAQLDCTDDPRPTRDEFSSSSPIGPRCREARGGQPDILTVTAFPQPHRKQMLWRFTSLTDSDSRALPPAVYEHFRYTSRGLPAEGYDHPREKKGKFRWEVLRPQNPAQIQRVQSLSSIIRTSGPLRPGFATRVLVSRSSSRTATAKSASAVASPTRPRAAVRRVPHRRWIGRGAKTVPATDTRRACGDSP